MSERNSIERHIERISGKQREDARAARERKERLKAQSRDKATKAKDMERRAKKFARWARQNNIPYDVQRGRIRTRGRWILAESATKRNRDKGGSYYDTLYVDRRGEIQHPLETSNKPATKEALFDHKTSFSAEDVHIAVAGLCVRYGLEAPDL